MTGESQLSARNGAGGASVPEATGLGRSLFEAREELEEVRLELRARVEADRMRELELVAARRDLEVKAAYNVMLERSLTQRQEQLDWTRGHIEHLDRIAQVDLPAALARAEHAEHRAAALAAELAAERNRASNRAVDYWVTRLGRHRILFGVLRRAVRGLRGIAGA